MNRTEIQRRDQHAWSHACATFLALPMLRGFWPMSSVNESGNAYDLSEQGRTLTYNGNPLYDYDGLAPYIDFDGTGDYLSRADEAGLDITGTETYVANPGLTMGGWFALDDPTPAAESDLFTKLGAVGNYSYRLVVLSTGAIYMQISDDGTNFDTASSGAGGMPTGWAFIVGRFNPSTTVDLDVNGTQYTQAAGVGASIFSGNGPLNISGFNNGSFLMAGWASMCFLCASYLSDDLVNALFAQTRALFGV